MKKIIAIIIFVTLIISCLTYFISGYTISDGVRVGSLIKISKKGLLFKTYEGDLNLGGVNNENQTIVNNIWKFSLQGNHNDSLYQILTNLQGQRVKLHYHQVVHNFFWQGETDYFVHQVSISD